MTSQELKCFVSVAEKLSFTKAAEELFFSVPTVTHHIKMLESELQTQLFIRNRRSVSLTHAGTVFYPDAKAILLNMEQAGRHLKESASGRLLRIGCTSDAELHMTADALAKLRPVYPDVEPHVVVDTYSRLLDLTENGKLDFMLASIHVAKHSHAKFRKLGMMKTYAVMPASDPLSARDSITFSELKDRRLLLPDQSLIPYKSNNPIRDLVDLHALHHPDIMMADDQVCLAMTRAGYGTAVLPGYRIPLYAGNLGVRSVLIEDNVDFEYGIIYLSPPNEDYERFFLRGLKAMINKTEDICPDGDENTSGNDTGHMEYGLRKKGVT